MDEEAAIKALSALASPPRLALFRALVRAGDEGLSARELALAAGIGPTNLTFHTKELERAGLIRSWRDGRRVISALNVGVMRELLMFLSEDCCGGRPELCGPIAVQACECRPVADPDEAQLPEEGVTGGSKTAKRRSVR